MCNNLVISVRWNADAPVKAVGELELDHFYDL